MNQHWLAWVPIVITAILMYAAKKTNVGVTNYNVFLLLLLLWSCVVVFYFRFLAVMGRKRRGEDA